MKTKKQGFTLVELVMVVVVLGVIAAVALPKFVDLRTEARASSMKQVASAITAGSAINAAAYKAGSPSAVPISFSPCSPGNPARMLGAPLPGNMTSTWISGKQSCDPLNGNAVACLLLTEVDGVMVSENFTMICTN